MILAIFFTFCLFFKLIHFVNVQKCVGSCSERAAAENQGKIIGAELKVSDWNKMLLQFNSIALENDYDLMVDDDGRNL